MSKLTIPKEYADGNVATTFTREIAVTIGSTVNNYFNNGNITGEQIRVDGIKGAQLSSTSVFDLTYFEQVNNIFTIPDDKLTDANLSDLNAADLLDTNTVGHDKYIDTTGGSQSIIEEGSVDRRLVDVALGDAGDYTPDDFVALFGSAPTGSEVAIRVTESSVSYNFSVDITTRGGPVCVMLIPNTTGSTATAPVTHTPSGGTSRGLRVSLYRGSFLSGTEVGRITSNLFLQSSRTDGTRDLTTGALTFYDSPPAGSQTYYLTNRQNLSGGNTVAWDLSNFRLVAYELI